MQKYFSNYCYSWILMFCIILQKYMKKMKPNNPKYLQSRNSQLTVPLPPPTYSAPAPCLWLSLGLQNLTEALTMHSFLSCLKDVYLKCIINKTNGCTSRITRDHLLRLLWETEKTEQSLPARNSSIPHDDLVSSNDCIRGLERNCDMHTSLTLIIM